MKKKHLVLTAATLSLAMALGACGSYAGAATSLTARSATEANAEHREGAVENTADATVISANGGDITVSGDGAVATDGTVTIRKAGTYVLRGNFTEGQLVADAEEGAEIKLILDGFTISNSTNAPLVFENGASVTIVLRDGTENAVSDLRDSAEDNKAAIYAKSDLTISGNGALAVQGNAEDAIHGEANVTVEGGTLALKAGDDGIHADETLTVRNGNINVTESEEGLEGLVVDIQGGVITVTAKDDGINASDGSGSDAAPGQATEGAAVRISGGMVTVKAGGDGIDSNGDLTISGGTVVVDGPSDGGNAPLDYDGKGVITGGTVFVTGDSGMFQTLNDSGSTQKSLVVSLNSTQGAGTKVTIADSKGNVVYENTATTQAFNTLLFSAADLKQDESYTVTVGSESQTVTVNDSLNTNAENGGNHGAPGGMPEGRPNGQRPEGRPENGGQQGGRGQNGNRPEGRSENGGQQGGRGQSGKRPEGRPENGGQQGGRGQNGKRPEGRPENGGQQGGRGQ
ncbi:carbohydrate-binding domain-containing protein, partial [Stomatobaculum longum]|uniref:carbohydrate-binding domain-containing protein n=1 Tax=Stomatobaculum longum TaxID=796942 RepID=UPI0028E8B70D